jgi:hypothetical protein
MLKQCLENIGEGLLHACISSYENNMKIYTAFIWDEKFSRVLRSRLLTGEISVTGIMFSHMNSIFPQSGITFCRVSNFSIQLMFSATSQPETYPVSRITFLHMNRTKIFGYRRKVFSLTGITFAHMGLFIWAKVIPVSEKTFRQVYKQDLALVWK